jgi:hypothetical protein
MRIQILSTVLVVSALAVPAAWACSPRNPQLLSPGELISSAEIIVRVRADGLSAKPATRDDAFEKSQVDFVVLETLKGTLNSDRITFKGHLEQHDDPNGGPVPYAGVRPRGLKGNCFALGYRQGAEYLLLLRLAYGTLTPYWSALAPVNEQLAGPDDPWIQWVRSQLKATR